MHLVLALACEGARLRPDGRLDVTGAFTELQAPGFPAAQDHMTVIFVMEWSAAEQGRRPFTADLVDALDRKVLTIEGHTDVQPPVEGRAPSRTPVVVPLENVVFPQAGEYRFFLEVDDEVRSAFSLFLSEASE